MSWQWCFSECPMGFVFVFVFLVFLAKITSGLHYTSLQAPHPVGQDLATAKIP